MEEHEIKALLNQISTKLEKKDNNNWLKVMVGTFGVLVFVVIFTAGTVMTDIKYIQENQIDREEYSDVKWKTNMCFEHLFPGIVGSRSPSDSNGN